MSWAALSAIRILPWQADSFFFIPGCIIIYFIYLFLLPVASSFLNGAADCCLTKRKNAEANVHILPFFPTFFASETIYWIPQATICCSNYWCYIAFLFSAASWLCTRLLCALRWNLLHNDSQTPMHFECSLSGVLNPPPSRLLPLLLPPPYGLCLVCRLTTSTVTAFFPTLPTGPTKCVFACNICFSFRRF